MENNYSLNGFWHVIYDDGNIGVTLEYQNHEVFSKNVFVEEQNVPSCLEESRQDYEGVAWYMKKFKANHEWQGKCIRLHFGAVNFRSEIWLNGIPIGMHEGGYTPFEFEISDVLDYEKDNYLVVRVITPIITKDIIIDGLQRDEAPHWRGAITGGIWQAVDIYVNENEYFKNVFVCGDIHKGDVKVSGVIVNPSLASTEKNLSVEIVDIKTDQVVNTVNIRFEAAYGEHEFTTTLDMKDFKYWSPDEPNMYKAVLAIGDSDIQIVRFGMREFTIKGSRFILNGKPIYLKSSFCEGLYPNTLSYPDDPDMIKNEIKLAKDAGMNLLRPWRKPQLPEVYDYADAIGMMYISAPPLECMKHWPKATPYLEKRIMNEIHEMIMRDRNHPCIVVWELFNEIRRLELARYKHKASVMARKLDQTRAIIDESGGNSNGANIYLPTMAEPTPFNDIHIYSGAYLHDGAYNKIKGFSKAETTGLNSVVRQGLFTIVTEIGYGSPGMLTELVEKYDRDGNPKSPDYRTYHMLLDKYKKAFDRYGFNCIYDNINEFFADAEKLHAQANLLMTEAARVNDKVAGIGIHAFTDGDWVIGAGLLDVYRKPKAAYYSAKKIYANQYVSIRTSAVNLYCGKPVEIFFTSVNDHDSMKATLKYKIVSKTGITVFESERSFVLENGINEPYMITVVTDKYRGIYTVDAEILSNGKVLCDNKYDFCVVEENNTTLDGVDVYMCYADEKLHDYMKRLGANVKPYVPGCKGLIFCGARMGQYDKDEVFHPDEEAVYAVGRDVENGAVALYMEFDQIGLMGNDKLYKAGELLPFNLKAFYTRGLWTPFNRAIKADAYTKGLPINTMMNNLYHNIAPLTSLDIGAGEWTVGGIGYDYGKDLLLDHLNYLGVAEPYAFADLLTKPYGKGKYILSTLRLVNNLEKDAFADTLMKNVVSTVLSLHGI